MRPPSAAPHSAARRHPPPTVRSPYVADRRLHDGDPLGQFWHRIRAAREALSSGSVTGAEQELLLPLSTLALSEHMRVVLLVEPGLLASLAGDEHALLPLERELAGLGARGEAALLAGLRHEIAGDRKAAIAAFGDSRGGRASTTSRRPAPSH